MDQDTSEGRLRLLELFPDRTSEGVGFNPQPDGRSALAVRCEGAAPGTRIVVRGVGLPTLRHGPELVTAFVPSELYRRPGQVQVYLRNGPFESNHLTFDVLGASPSGDPTPTTCVVEAAGRVVTADPAILILVPYFGSWPEWFTLFLETCRWNPSIDWLILTDIEPPPAVPPNVRFLRVSLTDLARRVAERLGYEVPIEQPYKLCDLRLAFGRIFADLLGDTEFFGWSDLDVVYGNIRRVLGREPLENDVITFYEHQVSGHLTLVRRTAATEELHLLVPDWMGRVQQATYQHLDEVRPDLLRARFPVWAEHSFNTPLSPYVPWRDGSFTFPTEWYWREGRLTNDVDGDVEFLYLHFMHWKGGEWPRACGNAHWERLERVVHLAATPAPRAFRVNARGFFPFP